VSLDDRTADRQAHSHATRLGGEKRAEQLIQVVRGDDLSTFAEQFNAWVRPEDMVHPLASRGA
jgi:hypothetical protein